MYSMSRMNILSEIPRTSANASLALSRRSLSNSIGMPTNETT